MKRKNRETSVFSISALDLFCSAMGVFMILCFVIMENEPKNVEVPPDVKVMNNLTLVLSLEADFENDPRWHPIAVGDLDLNVKMPVNGKQLEYTPAMKHHAEYANASYISDSVQGGADVWMVSLAPTGTYNVSYIINQDHGGKEIVKCRRKRSNGKNIYRYRRFRVTLRVLAPNCNQTIEHVYDKNEFCRGDKLIPISDIQVDSQGNIQLTECPRSTTPAK